MTMEMYMDILLWLAWSSQFGLSRDTRIQRSPTQRSEVRHNNGRLRGYIVPSNCMTGVRLTYKLDRRNT